LPSPWLTRWAHLIAPRGSVLDLACGSGRHLRWLAERGFKLTGVDRDAAALALLAPVAEVIVADIEAEDWPLAGRRFDAVIVANYLWRPLMPRIVDAVAPAGVLIYETFAIDNETVGRPSRPDFLLRRGELLAAVAGLRVVAFEDGFLEAPERFVQRVIACRDPAPSTSPQRHRLVGEPDRPG
jgi:SAM-dependent methyltransferase